MIDKFVGFDDSPDGINEDFEPEQVNLKQILNADFISKHSDFQSIEEIFDKYGEEVKLEEIHTYPMAKLDKIVSDSTEFTCWSEMYSEAIQEHLNSEF